MGFQYGNAVRTKTPAPPKYRPGETGSVCGFYTIEGQESAVSFGEPVGTIMILVEFPNGDATEIPEKWLEAV